MLRVVVASNLPYIKRVRMIIANTFAPKIYFLGFKANEVGLHGLIKSVPKIDHLNRRQWLITRAVLRLHHAILGIIFLIASSRSRVLSPKYKKLI